MSADRQQKIRARIEEVLAARNRRDWDALFADIDLDAEWEPIAETVVHRGREAITEYFARWDEAWAEFRIDVERIDVSRDEDLALLATPSGSCATAGCLDAANTRMRARRRRTSSGVDESLGRHGLVAHRHRA